MEQEINNLRKAFFILWSWTFNPQILKDEDLDWFYKYTIEEYAKERQPKETGEAITVSHGETKTGSADTTTH